jgi:KDO2-lipid IV(A) lauroyltransferase
MISKHLEKLTQELSSCVLKLWFWVVRVLPRTLLLSLSEILADAGFYLLFKFRKNSIKNLTLALGESLEGRKIVLIVRHSIRNFFRDIVEFSLAAEAPEKIRREICVLGQEHLDEALARGKGVIILSAHLGNFFLVGPRLTIEGYPAHALINQPRKRLFSEFIEYCRCRLRQRSIPARPRRHASRALLQVLRRNELAIVIADEFADEYKSGKGISVPFFGRTVLGRRGVATLSLRAGAPVLPAYMIRDPIGRLALVIEPEITLLRSGQINAAIRENVIRIAQWLEAVVRRYPDQWNWTNVHWQEAPPSEFRKGSIVTTE